VPRRGIETRLLLASVDAWLFEQESLVTEDRKALLPALRERQQLADSLLRHLAALGLERRAKPVDPEAVLARFRE